MFNTSSIMNSKYHFNPAKLEIMAKMSLDNNVAVSKFLPKHLAMQFQFCLRCNITTVEKSFNRISYCYDCGSKCQHCDKPGRVRRLETLHGWTTDMESLERHFNIRLKDVMTVRRQTHMQYYDNYIFNNVAYKILCSDCKYNFCALCKAEMPENEMVKIGVSSGTLEMTHAFCCKECVLHCKCVECRRTISLENVLEFENSTAEIIFGVYGYSYVLICFNHTHTVTACNECTSWQFNNVCETCEIEGNNREYIHNHQTFNNQNVTVCDENEAVIKMLCQIDNRQVLFNCIQSVSEQLFYPISFDTAVGYIERGMLNLGRKEVIELIIYAIVSRKRETIVSFYDQTGIPWYTYNKEICPDCEDRENMCVSRNKPRNLYHTAMYDTQCCNTTKCKVYSEDDDISDVFLNEYNYCEKCLKPLFEIMDVQFDSDFVCTNQESLEYC
ncbi:Adho3-like protein [Cryptophlebia peltastica nucleopolyhedrovirus]|uniref:Adho3-like protein n=1 Tax=Cryptophlebia peltastica nucleopolyhedrovirus TaxID=2304025 RepID=A0A346RNP9_9ABAC|nr:Adho3-like protein [Cryptophlebia peltastica nucleopolyhedrovirus]AXS67696.1 Adho3-like protein [Cryptophlebia peltastica nucleopolyhedrovirus]